MSKNELKRVELDERWSSYDDLLQLAQSIEGAKIRKSIFGNKTIVTVPVTKRSVKLTKKECLIETPYCVSGITAK